MTQTNKTNKPDNEFNQSQSNDTRKRTRSRYASLPFALYSRLHPRLKALLQNKSINIIAYTLLYLALCVILALYLISCVFLYLYRIIQPLFLYLIKFTYKKTCVYIPVIYKKTHDILNHARIILIKLICRIMQLVMKLLKIVYNQLKNNIKENPTFARPLIFTICIFLLLIIANATAGNNENRLSIIKRKNNYQDYSLVSTSDELLAQDKQATQLQLNAYASDLTENSNNSKTKEINQSQDNKTTETQNLTKTDKDSNSNNKKSTIKISQEYNDPTTNPDLLATYHSWKLKGHNGIDFVQTDINNKEVKSFYSGTVIFAGWWRDLNKELGFDNKYFVGGGIISIIKRDNSNLIDVYMHLAENKDLYAGKHIKRGDKIGTEGKSGNTLTDAERHTHISTFAINSKYQIQNIDNGFFGAVSLKYEDDYSLDNDKLDIIDLINQQKQREINSKYKKLVTPDNKGVILKKTRVYFEKYFSGTKVKPEEIVNIAENNNFDLGLLLINGHIESGMCIQGRAVISNNCHNVNNTTAGDNIPITICGMFTECNQDILAGEKKFIDLISNCYIDTSKNLMGAENGNEKQDISLHTFMSNDFHVQKTVKPFCDAKIGARYMSDELSYIKYDFALQNYFLPIFE
jgi:murein DD-endopeptidase MepM/ murein hydrolase activator NlpD